MRKVLKIRKKDILLNNYGTTGQIQVILAPLDQNLGELTHKVFSFPKNGHKNVKIVLSKVINK